MGRPKSKLTAIIDNEIASMLEASGAADPTDIYNLLQDHHSEVVQAELEEDARRGLMRRIESRLKHYTEIADESDEDMPLLPGMPEDLQRRMGRVITVEHVNGRCSYHELLHPNTTLGHVRSHVAILRRQRSALDSKIEAFIDALDRCGGAEDDTPFVTALQSAGTTAV
jgi:hypothetical protein